MRPLWVSKAMKHSELSPPSDFYLSFYYYFPPALTLIQKIMDMTPYILVPKNTKYMVIQKEKKKTDREKRKAW
jgi:hypothetical protein